MRPALIGAPLKMIEPQIVFELAILLFDRPAAAGERDEVDQRRRVRQVEQVSSIARMPARTGTVVRRCAQTRAASHGECVMKCWSA